MCAYVVLEDAPSVFSVEDASQDPRFQDNPLVLGPPYVRFYAGASLEIDGVKVGTLCIVDSKPREVRINGDNKRKAGKNHQGREIFGEKESSMLKDLAAIVTNLIRTRREENLFNISERLVMNADILKLYRIPLQNVVECKEEMKNKYDTLKGVVLHCQRRNHDYQMMNELDQLSHVFYKEIKRLSAISSSIISFFIDMSDISQAPPPSSSSSSQKNIQSLLPLAKHMSLMNIEAVQRNLKNFFQISSNMNEEKQSNQSNERYVKTHWIDDDWNHHDHSNAQTTKTSLNGSTRDDIEDPPSLKSVSLNVRRIYSYPLLLQLQMMILFDYYDFHETPVIISISPRFHSNFKQLQITQAEREEGIIGSGEWMILIEEQSFIQLQVNKMIDLKEVLQISSIYEDKLSHCDDNIRISSSQNRIEEESVKNSCSRKNCFVLKIPFYYSSSKPVKNLDPMLQTLILPELYVMDQKGKKKMKDVNDDEMNQKMKVITKMKLDPKTSHHNHNSNNNGHTNSSIFKQFRDYYNNFFSFNHLLSRHKKIHLK